MNAYIICGNYIWEGGTRCLGGIENYVFYLSKLLAKNNYKVYIYQTSQKPFVSFEDDVKIIGTGIKSYNRIVELVEKEADVEKDLLIFSTHYLIVKNHFKKSIAIQHGIAWDVVDAQHGTRFENVLSSFRDSVRAIKTMNLFSNCKTIVCVDYNFVNWYRTKVKYIANNIVVIPNYSQIPDINTRTEDCNNIRIIFARRLYKYRGTEIFTRAVKKILEKYPNITVTIAGAGGDEAWMRSELSQYGNVKFMRFMSEESIPIHLQHDIAVVPSLGSEGTSLSLLEAMAAGCAVIATNVGGMTNIVIDGDNGLMIPPNEDDLFHAMDKLIQNQELISTMGKRAHEVVKRAFSYERWVDAWEKEIGVKSNG